jgi:hypothetical protein
MGKNNYIVHSKFRREWVTDGISKLYTFSLASNMQEKICPVVRKTKSECYSWRGLTCTIYQRYMFLMVSMQTFASKKSLGINKITWPVTFIPKQRDQNSIFLLKHCICFSWLLLHQGLIPRRAKYEKFRAKTHCLVRKFSLVVISTVEKKFAKTQGFDSLRYFVIQNTIVWLASLFPFRNGVETNSTTRQREIFRRKTLQNHVAHAFNLFARNF